MKPLYIFVFLLSVASYAQDVIFAKNSEPKSCQIKSFAIDAIVIQYDGFTRSIPISSIDSLYCADARLVLKAFNTNPEYRKLHKKTQAFSENLLQLMLKENTTGDASTKIADVYLTRGHRQLGVGIGLLTASVVLSLANALIPVPQYVTGQDPEVYLSKLEERKNLAIGLGISSGASFVVGFGFSLSSLGNISKSVSFKGL